MRFSFVLFVVLTVVSTTLAAFEPLDVTVEDQTWFNALRSEIRSLPGPSLRGWTRLTGTNPGSQWGIFNWRLSSIPSYLRRSTTIQYAWRQLHASRVEIYRWTTAAASVPLIFCAYCRRSKERGTFVNLRGHRGFMFGDQEGQLNFMAPIFITLGRPVDVVLVFVDSKPSLSIGSMSPVISTLKEAARVLFRLMVYLASFVGIFMIQVDVDFELDETKLLQFSNGRWCPLHGKKGHWKDCGRIVVGCKTRLIARNLHRMLVYQGCHKKRVVFFYRGRVAQENGPALRAEFDRIRAPSNAPTTNCVFIDDVNQPLKDLLLPIVTAAPTTSSGADYSKAVGFDENDILMQGGGGHYSSEVNEGLVFPS